MAKGLKKKFDDFLFDHEGAKTTFEITKSILACIVAAAIYSFGYRCFMLNIDPSLSLVGGGMSGFSQIIAKILEIFNVVKPDQIATWQPIFNYLLNIPIFIVGWKYVGKRFSIFTLLTVALVSFFTFIIPQSLLDLFSFNEDLLARALFAGICTGIATVVGFKFGTSTGGFDVVSMAVANKKSTNIGKYLVIFNGLVLIGYTLTSYIYFEQNPLTKEIVDEITGKTTTITLTNPALKLFLFSAIYLFTNALMNDFMNKRFKKAQIQIITTNENMSNILISQFPHGCTVMNGKGAFSKKDKLVIYMVVSSEEVQKVVSLVQVADPNAFINVTTLSQVYGRFYIEPFK
ncbi:MAG: YitT family protein [Erysipelotrichales bacterium]|nr:YitT family protein [Erysipelotrichales bacterium]